MYLCPWYERISKYIHIKILIQMNIKIYSYKKNWHERISEYIHSKSIWIYFSHFVLNKKTCPLLRDFSTSDSDKCMGDWKILIGQRCQSLYYAEYILHGRRNEMLWWNIMWLYNISNTLPYKCARVSEWVSQWPDYHAWNFLWEHSWQLSCM